jgi:hypothetical protein
MGLSREILRWILSLKLSVPVKNPRRCSSGQRAKTCISTESLRSGLLLRSIEAATAAEHGAARLVYSMAASSTGGPWASSAAHGSAQLLHAAQQTGAYTPALDRLCARHVHASCCRPALAEADVRPAQARARNCSAYAGTLQTASL